MFLNAICAKRSHCDNLCEVMTETLTQWKLKMDQQACITTDNGSNITCAATCRLMWMRLPCFGHCLHLAVVNPTKDDSRIQHTVELCRKLVSTFSHNWKKKKPDLTKAQSNLVLPQHSLVTDCITQLDGDLNSA